MKFSFFLDRIYTGYNVLNANHCIIILVPHLNSTTFYKNNNTLNSQPNTNTSFNYIPSNLSTFGSVGDKQQIHQERHHINGTIMDDFFRQLNDSKSHMSNFTAPAALINSTASSMHNKPLLNMNNNTYNKHNNGSSAPLLKFGAKNGTLAAPLVNNATLQQPKTNTSRVNNASSFVGRNNNTVSFYNRNDTFNRGNQSTLQGGQRRTFFNRKHPTSSVGTGSGTGGNFKKSNIPHAPINLRKVSVA